MLLVWIIPLKVCGEKYIKNTTEVIKKRTEHLFAYKMLSCDFLSENDV
jgi:hypothetical protein